MTIEDEDIAFDAILATVHVLMADGGHTADAALAIVKDEINAVDVALEDERRVPLTPEQVKRAREHVKNLKARAQS